MALPALALGWLLVASVPAIRYKVQVRVDTLVRSPLLTETSPTRVVTDILLAPRLESELYTNRLDVKFVAEPQFFLRQIFGDHPFEFLTSVYADARYKLRRDFTLLAVHTTTLGTFPLNDFAGAGGSSLPVNTAATGLGVLSSAYVYTESVAGFQTSLGVRRLSVAGTIGWIVNGLLDYPTKPRRRMEAAYPQQRYPELRLESNYAATPRDYLSVLVLGRDVAFSTANRDALLRVAPGLKHFLNPLVSIQLAPGVAVGRVYPRRPDEAPENFSMPTVEAGLDAPVPLGLHWPVKAKLRLNYVPYMDPLSTQLIPRGEAGLGLEWKGRRDAIVKGSVRYAHPLTDGLHRHDQEVQAEAEALLPLSRYLFVQTKETFIFRRHAVLGSLPPVQWLTSLGLVVRYDRGRL